MHMKITSTVDIREKEKFAQHAQEWWDPNGPLKTLHDINPTRLAFVTQHMAIKDKKILDLGCGGGIFTEALVRKGAQVEGLDVEPVSLKTAEEHAAREKLAIEYHCSPVESWQGGPYDAICCMEMLEHVNDPLVVIHHCQRLLKPSGMLFLSTINRTMTAYAGVIVAAEYLLRLLPRQTHDFKKFIKPAELAAMLRRESFEVLVLKGMSYNPLSRNAALSSNVSMNYLIAARKSN